MEDVIVVSDGTFLLDGGTIFGIVPREAWARLSTPDRKNRIRLGLNCLLVRADGGYALLEAGLGEVLPATRAYQFPVTGPRLPEGLAALNVDPADVRWVILTHLHFDHAGWLVRRKGDEIVPTFPNARHVVQRKELAAAAAPPIRMRGSYLAEQWKTISDAGLWHEVDGDEVLLDGVRVVRTGGHSEGHQLVLIERSRARVLFWGDIAATWWHLRPAWTTAYDVWPDEVVRVKLDWIDKAIGEDWVVASYHDPDVPLAHLARDAHGSVRLVPVSQPTG